MTMTETASHLGEKLSDAKEQVKGLGRTAGEKVDQARHKTAEGLQTAASSVRAAGRYGSEAIDSLATNTAGQLDSAATYVGDYHAGGLLAHLRQVVRRNPASFLIMVATIGFVVGSICRPDQGTKS